MLAFASRAHVCASRDKLLDWVAHPRKLRLVVVAVGGGGGSGGGAAATAATTTTNTPTTTTTTADALARPPGGVLALRFVHLAWPRGTRARRAHPTACKVSFVVHWPVLARRPPTGRKQIDDERPGQVSA